MKSLADIKNELSLVPIENIQNYIIQYQSDSRIGVQKLLKQYETKFLKYNEELQRIQTISQYENDLYSKGAKYIAGIDEVGRGPLAGPVVTCAVILPQNCNILGINDSKKLSESKREELYIKIKEEAFAISLAMSNVETIDNINILQATLKAMSESINKLSITPDYVLADAVTIPNIKVKQRGIIKGDSKSISIGAASIIAKVTRDHMMAEFDKIYPEYGFAKNKGYGTEEHIAAIKKHGLCPIHRKTFVKNIQIDD